MTKSYGRAPYVMASLFALAIASTNCSTPFEPGAESIDRSEIGPRAQADGDPCPTGIETTVIELGPNHYYIAYRTTLNASFGVVWSKVQNFETLLQIAFAGATTDFEWVDGSPGQTPSLVEFNLGEQRLVEEVQYRDSGDKVLRYAVAEAPVLGIEEYTGEIDLDTCGSATTLFEFTRDVTFSEGVDVNTFLDLFMSEIVNIRTYFENHPNG
jgi:hypothetical protein